MLYPHLLLTLQEAPSSLAILHPSGSNLHALKQIQVWVLPNPPHFLSPLPHPLYFTYFSVCFHQTIWSLGARIFIFFFQLVCIQGLEQCLACNESQRLCSERMRKWISAGISGSVNQSVQSLSSVQLFETLWTAACQASLSITNFRSLLKLMSIKSVMPSNRLILCHPLLLPSIFPSIRIFPNESVLRIRWPK